MGPGLSLRPGRRGGGSEKQGTGVPHFPRKQPKISGLATPPGLVAGSKCGGIGAQLLAFNIESQPQSGARQRTYPARTEPKCVQQSNGGNGRSELDTGEYYGFGAGAFSSDAEPTEGETPCASEELEPAAGGRVAEVAAAADHFLEAFDRLDWVEFAACWGPSPTVFFPFPNTPELVLGRPAVTQRFRRFFGEAGATACGAPTLGLQPQGLRVQLLGEAGLVTLEFPGEQQLARRSLLCGRHGDAWLLEHLCASNISRQ